nr:hypothetical protein Ade03nite_65200 [Actinoplanes derwentensis]
MLVMTEHRRGCTGEIVGNTDVRRDTLVRADGVLDLLAYIPTTINPLQTLDGKVDLRRNRAEKLVK